MDKDIVWQAFYTILGEYAANRPLDYHNYLDLKQIPFDEKWEKIYDAYDNDEPIAVTVIYANSSGLLIDIFGYKGFVPYDEIDYKMPQSRPSYISQSIDCRIIAMDSLKKMFVLSHRDCLSHFIPKILENPITKGQIFDASGDKVLVDLGLFDGYIDLKETRLKDSDFHVGDFVEFKITRFDDDGAVSVPRVAV